MQICTFYCKYYVLPYIHTLYLCVLHFPAKYCDFSAHLMLVMNNLFIISILLIFLTLISHLKNIWCTIFPHTIKKEEINWKNNKQKRNNTLLSILIPRVCVVCVCCVWQAYQWCLCTHIRIAYELRLINKTKAGTHNVHKNIEMSPVGRARGRE